MTKPEARVVPARPADLVELSVLSLVSTPDAAFYADQLEALSELGVETTVLPASSSETADPAAIQPDTDVRRLAAEVADRTLAEYDLIHAIHGRTGVAALAQTDLPVVLSLWGTDRHNRDEVPGRHAARRADAVVVPSESVGESLGQDCAIIPRGVDLERVRPQPRGEARAAVGWDAAAKHVFQPATSRSDDGHDLAARAVATADGRIDDPVVLHAPDTPVPHGEMAIYLSAADAMVLPTEFDRAPTAAAEAMACNLPLVTMADGYVAERLAPVDPSPVCGSESAFADALVEVLRRGERSTGRAYARDLHTERTAWRVFEVYRDVLERDS